MHAGVAVAEVDEEGDLVAVGVEAELRAFGFGDDAGGFLQRVRHDPGLQCEGTVGQVEIGGLDFHAGRAVGHVEGDRRVGGDEGVPGERAEIELHRQLALGQGGARAFLEVVGFHREDRHAEVRVVDAAVPGDGESHGLLRAGLDDGVLVVGGDRPALGAGDRQGDFERPGGGVGKLQFVGAGALAGGIEREGRGRPWGHALGEVEVLVAVGREELGIDRAADRQDADLDAIGADGDDVEMMEIAEPRILAGDVAAGGGEGEVFDAVLHPVVAQAVDVTAEAGADVAVGDEELVDLVPVVAGIDVGGPARVVHEDEDVLEGLHFLQRLLQPGELGLAEFLLGGIAEVARLGGIGGIALVGEQHEEAALLVLEPVPERAEVLFISLLVFERRAALAAPVDVVIAGDGEPRHAQVFHGVAVFVHLDLPLVGGVVTLDQIADGHDEVGVEQVAVGDRLGQHLDAFRRAAGAVAEDDEVEGVVALRQGEQDGIRAVGADFRRVGGGDARGEEGEEEKEAGHGGGG